jgi:L-ribulose-5-phosphate 3-epimerase UlaE
VNRKPFTYYLQLHKQFGFTFIHQSFDKTINPLSRKQLAKKFSNLTDEELNTSGMYILSKKANG